MTRAVRCARRGWRSYALRTAWRFQLAVEYITGAPQLWLRGSYAVRGGLLTKIVFELAGTSRIWTGVSAYDLDPKLLARTRNKTSPIYTRKE